MDAELWLKEMIEIALNEKRPEETTYFSKINLDPTTIRWGCMRIADWLCIQSVALRLRPLELKPSSELDMACLKLIEAADFLREVMEIREGRLKFVDRVSVGQAQAMMLYAKEHYRPPLFTALR
ncbi:hypothetical protein [Thermogutta sp.]|jgi:hypothetical protein|uniref:hypothetical protein n=1 Tax=Thermogutta sp. TaxID=1962930 RepID=UPI0032208ABD